VADYVTANRTSPVYLRGTASVPADSADHNGRD
jgi:hypothetical protein